MDGDEYIIIEEKHSEEIIEAYCKTLELEDVPEEFRNKWIESYLQNRG